MTLICNWREVLAKSWAIRLALVSAALTAIEVALPLFTTVVPAGLFAIAATIIGVAGAVARVVYQASLSGAK